jgi:predicted house-cleaning noncanonical NTP pyrophosphatase (MazG superfamily)
MTAEQKFEKFFNSFPRYGTTLAEDWKKEIVELSKDFTEQKCKELLEIVAEKAETKTEKKSQYGKYRKWQKVKEGGEFDLFSYHMKVSVDKNSILNAVNLKEFIQ